MSAFDRSCAGVWLHSYAARMIKKGLMAEDIIKNYLEHLRNWIKCTIKFSLLRLFSMNMLSNHM